MAKPIFVVRIKKHLPEVEFDSLANRLRDMLYDYHVFLINPNDDTQCRDIEFQLFSDKEIKPIDLDRLKEIANEARK
jgi:hypothetical protein